MKIEKKEKKPKGHSGKTPYVRNRQAGRSSKSEEGDKAVVKRQTVE